MITKDPMNYKSNLKFSWEEITRLRIIKDRIYWKMKVKDIVFKYDLSRNIVSRLVKKFNIHASPKLKEKLKNGNSLTKSEIKKRCWFLKDKSKKPHSHSKQASKEQEQHILDYYNNKWHKVWPKRIYNILKCRNKLNWLTFWQIKW